MKKHVSRIPRFLAVSLAVVCTGFVSGAEDNPELPLQMGNAWQVFLMVSPPETYTSIPETLSNTAGGDVKAIITALKDGHINLAALNNGQFVEGGTAVLYNEFISEKAGQVRIGVAADWWLEAYINGKQIYSTMKSGNGTATYTPDDHPFELPVQAGKNLFAVKVLSGSAGWQFVCGVPSPPKPNVKFEADDEWKPINMQEPMIQPGSALDQSVLAEIPRTAEGRLPRLAIGPTGKLIAEGCPEQEIRLRGYNNNTPWTFGRDSKNEHWQETWRDEIATSKRQGYNIIRVSFSCLCSVTTNNLDTIAKNMERADYLLSEFGKQGVYAYLCIAVNLTPGWIKKFDGEVRDYALRMYLGDPQIRRAWKLWAEGMMNHVNKYNGLAWKDDPVIACAGLYNEQEWGFFHPKSNLAPETQAQFDAAFRAWLEAKYKTAEALAKAWGDGAPESFAQVVTPEYFPRGVRNPGDNDFLLFCAEISHSNSAWMRDTLRGIGYEGLTAHYNISHWLGGQEARYVETPVTIANTYHNHPTAFSRPGSKCGQNSAVGGALSYWRGIASMRFADRPFIETEFNHSFWNPYQHECGIGFGAYSALQGFDGLLVHEGSAFFYRDRPLDAFSVGRSPICRANEFVLNSLYLPGGVKSSPHRIELRIPQGFLEKDGNSGRTVSTFQNRLALLTGFSLSFPDSRPAKGVGKAGEADLVMPPAGGAEFQSGGGGWCVNAIDGDKADFSLPAAVANLKAKGILAADNVTDPDAGIFQSDTGEITMRTKENLLKVAAGRVEAISLEGDRGEPIGKLDVQHTTVPALVAACAMDQVELAASRRVVLVYSTYAVNTGMELSPDRATLVELGKQPILMQTGKLDVTLENTHAKSMKLYALGFDGARREELPLEVAGDTLRISLDTGTLKDGPTPFFELSAEAAPQGR